MNKQTDGQANGQTVFVCLFVVCIFFLNACTCVCVRACVCAFMQLTFMCSFYRFIELRTKWKVRQWKNETETSQNKMKWNINKQMNK